MLYYEKKGLYKNTSFYLAIVFFFSFFFFFFLFFSCKKNRYFLFQESYQEKAEISGGERVSFLHKDNQT